MIGSVNTLINQLESAFVYLVVENCRLVNGFLAIGLRTARNYGNFDVEGANV